MRFPLIGLMALLLSLCALADDRQPPASWQLDMRSSIAFDEIDQLHFPSLDLDQIAVDDANSEAMGEPPRFAVPHAVRLSPIDRGQWDSNGELDIWRLAVRADGASLINFGFEDVYLPAGSSLYIYSGAAAKDRQMSRFEVIGPYGPEINRSHGEFWTPNLIGEHAIIEVNMPRALRDQFSLALKQVSHGYRGFGSAASGYRQSAVDSAEASKQACETTAGARSGACNQDVACLSDDDPWNDPRRSVAAYQRSGAFACTGSLVNNTANDQRLLFLTARHCISAAQTASAVVYWDYEWPTCRRPGASGGTAVNPPDPNLSNSGATFLASTSNPFQGNCTAPDECSDVFLMELDGEPNPLVELHWAGWDRRPPPSICAQGPGNSTAGLCATIHHPGVDEKRITWVAQDIQVGNIAGAQNIHWHPFWHPNPPELPNMPGGSPATIPPAVTEGGSSGSPLYSADRRLLGVLSGGPAFCGATGASLSDFYGGLWHAWEGMGTATTRMRDYLDPLGTGALFIDGIDGIGFELTTDTPNIGQCGFEDIDLVIDITPLGDFEGDVALSLENLDPAISGSFSINPATAPGSTTLTLENLDSAGIGGYDFIVAGVSREFDAELAISLMLSDEAPSGVGIVSPADGAIGVFTSPSFVFEAEQGETFDLEIASDEGFSDVVYSADMVSSDHVVSTVLDTSSSYFARVRSANQCGQSEWSAPISFTTQAAPGDCPTGTQETALLSEDFAATSLPAGWSTSGSGAANWVLSTAQSHSGGRSMFAQNIASISDQRLTTPTISLPDNAAGLFMTFQNWQSVESAVGGCFDGGLLELSADGGETWTQLGSPHIVTREYDGPISSSWGNPLAGLDGWCGDPRTTWEEYLVNLGAWGGQDVQLRFRFGTDSSVSRIGWHVDSVDVKACLVEELPPEIFSDRFEEPAKP